MIYQGASRYLQLKSNKFGQTSGIFACGQFCNEHFLPLSLKKYILNVLKFDQDVGPCGILPVYNVLHPNIVHCQFKRHLYI